MTIGALCGGGSKLHAWTVDGPAYCVYVLQACLANADGFPDLLQTLSRLIQEVQRQPCFEVELCQLPVIPLQSTRLPQSSL